MRELLVINPNTTASVTRLLAQHAQAVAGMDVRVTTIQARFGAPYISDETSYAVAGHATLDAYLHHRRSAPTPPAAVLIACFGDPALFALQEVCDVPVTGLAAASFCEAAQLGPFAIVTGGARWPAMLHRLAHALGYADALSGTHTVKATGAQLAADPAAAKIVLREACLVAVEKFQINSLILGGAGLAGMATELQHDVPVPIIDSVQAGVRQAVLSMSNATQAVGDQPDVSWLTTHSINPL
ncbi:aspartate/glutamate racemase family protein [Limnohabitans sp.]|uniref:aspartate/glutamate racemase family protein n=1 Tax=Limnohabitans sp. TaxID=1907725 RepID=UPI0038B9A4A6